MDPKTMQRRGMMPLDEEGKITVSKPTIRPEMQAAADRRFRQGGVQSPMNHPTPQPESGRFPPMDMRGPNPNVLKPQYRGPPNPNPDFIPPGGMNEGTWIQTAQGGPSDEELMAMIQMGLV